MRSNAYVIFEFKGLTPFLILSSCFFLFVFTSLLRSDLTQLSYSISPMLPMPLIGILFIFNNRTDLKLSSRKISKFSQISILFCINSLCFIKSNRW